MEDLKVIQEMDRETQLIIFSQKKDTQGNSYWHFDGNRYEMSIVTKEEETQKIKRLLLKTLRIYESDKVHAIMCELIERGFHTDMLIVAYCDINDFSIKNFEKV